MEERVRFFKSEDKLIEAQRIEERTNFDVEMLRETGICSGIENYSRHLSGSPAGAPPYCICAVFYSANARKISSAMAWAIKGGTALPTCVNWGVSFLRLSPPVARLP